MDVGRRAARQVEDGMFEISRPFNAHVDRMVLDMWRDGRAAEFLAMLPDHAARAPDRWEGRVTAPGA